MSDRPTIRGSENQRIRVPGLTRRDLILIDQAGPAHLRAAPASIGWDISLGPICGVLELDACQLVIEPKLIPDGATVLQWISYTQSIPTELDLLRRWSTSATGVRDLIVAALLTECTTLLRGGLLRGYRRHQTIDTALRGRLDVPRQITRRYGQVDQLHLHRYGRDTDIWENLVCAAALDEAAKLTGTTALQHRARTLAAMFAQQTPKRAAVRRWLATARYHRLNSRYRPAHHWAALLLDSGGPEDVLIQGAWPAGTLLFDMNRLWERIVSRLCDEICDTGHASAMPAITVHEPGRRPRQLRPDAFVRTTSRAIPVDAKYKDYATTAVERNDTHQLLTYAAAFWTPSDPWPLSIIVHPSTISTARTVAVTSGHTRLGDILVIGLNVAGVAEARRSLVTGMSATLSAPPQSP